MPGSRAPTPVHPHARGELPRCPKTHLAPRFWCRRLVVFSPFVHTPAVRGTEDGEGRRTRTGLGGPAGDCDRVRMPSARGAASGGFWGQGWVDGEREPLAPVVGRSERAAVCIW